MVRWQPPADLARPVSTAESAARRALCRRPPTPAAQAPEAIRLLTFKADGSFQVHADAGGFKPLNCG